MVKAAGILTIIGGVIGIIAGCIAAAAGFDKMVLPKRENEAVKNDY